MIVIYSYGCTSCGTNGRMIKKAIQYAKDNNLYFEVKNTKYDEFSFFLHKELLITMNQDNFDHYPTIIIENDNVILLKDHPCTN